MSKFNKFVARLRVEGYSNQSAHNIAASEGFKKYGVEAMERKSQAAKERHEARTQSAP
jgi:hypothetical protein